MKLFFSYGHDENEEIVMRLKRDIEEREHSVWIDKSQIKSGDDWRRTITAGILDSEFMMSFASNHSVRKPGVCLDELMIAVSVKGAQVQTVLLEADIVPPSNIGYRQYIDMSKWREIKETPEFEIWYAEKLNEIISVIESPDTSRYAEEIEYLKEQLCPDLSTMKKDRLRQEYYCGREWLSKEVVSWMKAPDSSKVLVIDGAPGIGKSSYMAHEFMFNPSVGAIIFCEWDQQNFNNLDSLSRSLVFQLATKIPDYRYQLVKYLKSEQKRTGAISYMPQNNEGIFRQLFVQQLRSLIDGNRPVILILIDGLDEVIGDSKDSGRRKNIFAELLQTEANNFPRWIKFLITSRRDVSVLKPLKDAELLHIDEKSQDNKKDILHYITHELSDLFSEYDIGKIAEKCAGNFLYAKMICSEIVQKKVSISDILSGKAGDLGFIYRKYFDRTFTDFDLYENEYYIPLAVLAVTEGAIPNSTFRKITGWSERQFNKGMKILSPYLTSGREEFALYHKSLRDWLFSDDADDYMVEREDGERAIADGCYQAYEQGSCSMNDYEKKYLLPMLEKLHDKRCEVIMSDVILADLFMSDATEERRQFKYDVALIKAEQALKIYLHCEKIEKVLQTYLFLAEITDLMVRLDDAVNYCREALKVANAETENIAGEILMRMAYVLFRQGKWNESIDAYDSSSKTFSKTDASIQYIETLVMKANVLRHTNQSQKALSCYDEIMQLKDFASLEQKNPELYAKIIMNHGWVLHNLARYNEASEKLIESERLINKYGTLIDNKHIAQMYYLRAIELFEEATYEKAADYCNKALYYDQLAYGDNAVELCSSLNQLGAIRQKQNNIAEALQLFLRSYHIRLNYYGEKNLFTTISLRNYAKTLLRRGKREDLDTVHELFQKVLSIRKELSKNGMASGWLAQIYLDMADYYNKVENYSSAKLNISMAEDLYSTGGTDRDIATCKMQMGIILYNEEKMNEASDEFSTAIDIRKKYYGEDHPYMVELKGWFNMCNRK